MINVRVTDSINLGSISHNFRVLISRHHLRLSGVLEVLVVSRVIGAKSWQRRKVTLSRKPRDIRNIRPFAHLIEISLHLFLGRGAPDRRLLTLLALRRVILAYSPALRLLLGTNLLFGQLIMLHEIAVSISSGPKLISMSWTIRNLWHVVRDVVDVVIEAWGFLHLILGVSIVVDEVYDLFVLAVEIDVIHNFIDSLCRCLIHILKRNITLFGAGRIQVLWAIDSFIDLFWCLEAKNVLLSNRCRVSLLLLLMLVAYLLSFVRDLILAALAVRTGSETQVLIFHFWVFVFLWGDCLLDLLPKFRVLSIPSLFGLCLGWWAISFLLLCLLLRLIIWILLLLLFIFLLYLLLVIRVHFIDLSSDLSSYSLHRVYSEIWELLHQHGKVEFVVVYALPSLSALQLVYCHDFGISYIFDYPTSIIITRAQFTQTFWTLFFQRRRNDYLRRSYFSLEVISARLKQLLMRLTLFTPTRWFFLNFVFHWFFCGNFLNRSGNIYFSEAILTVGYRDWRTISSTGLKVILLGLANSRKSSSTLLGYRVFTSVIIMELTSRLLLSAVLIQFLVNFRNYLNVPIIIFVNFLFPDKLVYCSQKCLICIKTGFKGFLEVLPYVFPQGTMISTQCSQSLGQKLKIKVATFFVDFWRKIYLISNIDFLFFVLHLNKLILIWF